MSKQNKIEKIVDYLYRKSLLEMKFRHPSRFDEFKDYLDLIGKSEIDVESQKKEFHKLIFTTNLRKNEWMRFATKEECQVLFDNLDLIHRENPTKNI